MKQFEFKGTDQEVADHVRWCRREFGARGNGWDFSGRARRVTILITEDKYATFYSLKFGHRSENI
jgi:hypothetical protein